MCGKIKEERGMMNADEGRVSWDGDGDGDTNTGMV